MAQFINDNNLADMIASIEKLSNTTSIYEELISSGQEIMKDKIQAGANKHRSKLIREHMADSLKCTKPTKDKEGYWVGRVKFSGSSGMFISKKGKKFDATHWIKAFRIENGTSKQAAEPFVKPAIAASDAPIRKEWNEIFERELKKL